MSRASAISRAALNPVVGQSRPSVAFLFPGQGSQAVGMGAGLRAADAALFDDWMHRAEAASGLPIARYALEGPATALMATEVAQPALFALSLAIAETAGSMGVRPSLVAGHSLGEYTAAVVAGALAADDGIRLVVERGRLMAAAQRCQPGAMGVVLGLPLDAVEAVCREARVHGIVAVANVNSPRQVVVSGVAPAVSAAVELAGVRGGVARLLPVGGAFHSEMMATVQTRLGRLAATMTWRDAQVPLVSNSDGSLLTSAGAIRDALIGQVTRPVRWTDCMETMLALGCRHFLELGPGRVLTGLGRSYSREALLLAADAPEELVSFTERVATAGARAEP